MGKQDYLHHYSDGGLPVALKLMPPPRTHWCVLQTSLSLLYKQIRRLLSNWRSSSFSQVEKHPIAFIYFESLLVRVSLYLCGCMCMCAHVCRCISLGTFVPEASGRASFSSLHCTPLRQDLSLNLELTSFYFLD